MKKEFDRIERFVNSLENNELTDDQQAVLLGGITAVEQLVAPEGNNCQCGGNNCQCNGDNCNC
jgi:hypothetical protein